MIQSFTHALHLFCGNMRHSLFPLLTLVSSHLSVLILSALQTHVWIADYERLLTKVI